MLYLHCGWIKTGTTSLQAALAGHRAPLREAGVVYAQEWRVLTKALSGPRAETAIGEFRRFLEGHAGEDVLCSNECFTHLLWSEASREAFRALLVAAGEVMPVRSVWTLRRFDDLVASAFLWTLMEGDLEFSLEQSAAFPWVEETIGGMRELEDAFLGGVEYLRYDSGGRHNSEVLSSVGLSTELVEEIERELASAPRHNTAIGHKQAAALLDSAAVSARAGIALDRHVLRDAFRRGGFQFDEDRPCSPLDARTREVLHGRALKAAYETGLQPYVRFFEGSEIAEDRSPGDMGVASLGGEDLKRLVEHFHRRGPTGAG